MFHIQFLKLVVGIFVSITLPSNVVSWVMQEKTDGSAKVITNRNLVVSYKFPEVASLDSTKLEHLRCKEIHALLPLLRIKRDYRCLRKVQHILFLDLGAFQVAKIWIPALILPKYLFCCFLSTLHDVLYKLSKSER